MLLAAVSGIRNPVGVSFPYMIRLALMPSQPPVKWVPGLVPVSEVAGA